MERPLVSISGLLKPRLHLLWIILVCRPPHRFRWGQQTTNYLDSGLPPQDVSPTFDFTGVRISNVGSSNVNDFNNFRIIYDVNNNGTYDGGDIVAGSSIPYSNPLSFTITGQTNISSPRRYLLVGDVLSAASATAGNYFDGSLTAANVTAGAVVTGGTVNGNNQTIAPVNDFCAKAIELIVDDPAVPGTLTGATYTTPPALTPTGAEDVWYKFTSSCTFNHTITISGFTGNNIRATLYSGSCTAFSTISTSATSGTTRQFSPI